MTKDVSELTLTAVMEIQHREVNIQKEQAITSAEQEVAGREEAADKKYRKAKRYKKDADTNAEYYKKELQDGRDVMDTQNCRFESVF